MRYKQPSIAANGTTHKEFRSAFASLSPGISAAASATTAALPIKPYQAIPGPESLRRFHPSVNSPVCGSIA